MNKRYKNILGVLFVVISFCAPGTVLAQTEGKSGSHSTRPKGTISAEARALIEEAIGQVCNQAKLDPKASMAIDEMQSRPSLPVQTPEAKIAGARAQRLLPLAKSLVIASLQQLTTEYGLDRNRVLGVRIQQGIARVNAVKTVKPDMESRDNASVFLSRPHTITFGTIFLAGLRSDEGMISVLAHELIHIADGDHDR